MNTLKMIKSALAVASVSLLAACATKATLQPKVLLMIQCSQNLIHEPLIMIAVHSQLLMNWRKCVLV